MPIRFASLDRCSQAARACNEDAVGATAAAAWVIDGTKGPFDHRLTPGLSDATWYAEALNAALHTYFAAPPAEPLPSLSRAAAELSRTYLRNAREAPAHEQPSACLALAALDAAGMLHLFNIGDCRILIEQASGVRPFGSSGIERLEQAAIAELARLRATHGAAGDPWIELRATLRRNFETAMNRPGGYWVTHPTLPWLHQVQTASLAAGTVDHLLIASDGFFRLVNVFGAYDEAGLIWAARARGLAALCAELRSREAEDDTCRRYPRLKASDDASAVLVRVRG
ncbi:MAG TPA: hypothetical protein VGQ35_21240 [Dongiaceae bacterium]|jgi:serine/threonine protein phosphatase PrpC|nr:hypothetical protein [Dongiaceae bacterium]